jgi:hypothetical protein
MCSGPLALLGSDDGVAERGELVPVEVRLELGEDLGLFFGSSGGLRLCRSLDFVAESSQ